MSGGRLCMLRHPMSETLQTDIVVLGGGPGGYAAAFYAADKGRKVVLVDEWARLGGVCLNSGCIPSKALLHATHQISAARDSAKRGIVFEPPKIDASQLRVWKESLLTRLGQGIGALAQRRGVFVVHGRGSFVDSKTLRVACPDRELKIHFEKAIIATGVQAVMPHAFDIHSPRVMTSKEALDIPDIPASLLVIGGGYIGMELGTVYAALGSKVTVVEALETIMAGADPDLVRPVVRHVEKLFAEIRVKTRVVSLKEEGEKIRVVTESDGATKEETFDRVLVSVGRAPNCKGLGLETTRVELDEKGFIRVDARQETSESGIFAIGDVTGGALLAHKAAKDARVAVDAIAGEVGPSHPVVIPAVVFTDPEVAWCGLTETEAKEKNIPVEVVRFPWGASGRAMTMDRTEGVTKLILEPKTERILGVGITGVSAGELIAEGVLAIQLGAKARDVANAMHPHPTLSETLMECAELFYGHATHAYVRKKA